jgi:tetratricopeptide (TPR) repeat protein
LYPEAVKESHVIPAQVLAKAGTRDPFELTKLGVAAAKEERWQTAIILLAEAYKSFAQEPELPEGGVKVESDPDDPFSRKQARSRMFSYYGLALAMSNHTRAEEAARFCEIAIQQEPFQAEHYVNLARIWQAARNRLKTVQALNRGLAQDPTSRELIEMRGEIGWREKNPVSFLPRDHPINVRLGKMMRKKKPEPDGPSGKNRS